MNHCFLPCRLLMILGILGTLSIASPTRAQLRVYADEAAFLAAAGSVITETFDAYRNNSYFLPPLDLHGMIFNTQQGDDDYAIANTFGSLSPDKALFDTDIDTQRISFHDRTSVSSFGFWFIVPDTSSDTAWEHDVYVTERNGTTTPFKIVSPPGNRRHYLGFTSWDGIDHLVVDDVQRRLELGVR